MPWQSKAEQRKILHLHWKIERLPSTGCKRGGVSPTAQRCAGLRGGGPPDTRGPGPCCRIPCFLKFRLRAKLHIECLNVGMPSLGGWHPSQNARVSASSWHPRGSCGHRTILNADVRISSSHGEVKCVHTRAARGEPRLPSRCPGLLVPAAVPGTQDDSAHHPSGLCSSFSPLCTQFQAGWCWRAWPRGAGGCGLFSSGFARYSWGHRFCQSSLAGWYRLVKVTCFLGSCIVHPISLCLGSQHT